MLYKKLDQRGFRTLHCLDFTQKGYLEAKRSIEYVQKLTVSMKC
jgi:hypothetical protein